MEGVALVGLGVWGRDLSTAVALGVERGLGCTVTLSTQHLDVERFYDSHRGQDRSTPMLAELEATRPVGLNRVLGLTSVDLFVPVLTFVFGEAHLSGTAAVVSSRRLDPAAYGLPADTDHTVARTAKEAVHELGHTYGLVHCRDYACVMRASRAVEEVDSKADGFCPACAGRLVDCGLQPALREP